MSMRNIYLETLELAPGATKKDIKSAYRRLSKRYHPDVSKDDNAKAKFIEINEAYKFLTSVGPTPVTHHQPAPDYDFDPAERAYDEWRKKAHAYAEKRTKDAIRRQKEWIKMILRGFEWISVFVVSFNIMLAIDSQLTPSKFEENVVALNPSDNRGPSNLNVLQMDQHRLYFGNEVRGLRFVTSATVYASRILDIPVRAKLKTDHQSLELEHEYSLLGFFSILTKIILGGFILYKFVLKTLDAQLTLAIALPFVYVFQLLMWLKY